MNKTKQTFVFGFALFSLFFGAGNLLLPPLLGYNAGDNWFWVAVGFIITAVMIPICGIFAHARLQGTMFDFAKKVSPMFSIIYCVIVYIISATIPSPRTAAATHEIAIHPIFQSSSLLTSSIYFALVLLFVLNRSKILNIIGKFLTPIIAIIILLIICVGVFSNYTISDSVLNQSPMISGILEGYQTFDAIGAVVVGAVIIVSLNYNNDRSFEERKRLIKKSGLIAGLGLFVIYAGLILLGAMFNSEVDIDTSLSNDMQRASLLRYISTSVLGNIGNTFFSVLVSLACFTTAIGIVAGTADYFKGLINNSNKVYVVVAIVSCLLGVIVGQLNFHTIIIIAIPVLLFIYPITIVLIMLNILPERMSTPLLFRAAVLVTFLFSVPDVIKFINPSTNLINFLDWLPLVDKSLGWVIPAVLTSVIVILLNKKPLNS